MLSLVTVALFLLSDAIFVEGEVVVWGQRGGKGRKDVRNRKFFFCNFFLPLIFSPRSFLLWSLSSPLVSLPPTSPPPCDLSPLLKQAVPFRKTDDYETTSHPWNTTPHPPRFRRSALKLTHLPTKFRGLRILKPWKYFKASTSLTWQYGEF